jgi:hypothetical protein
MKYLSLVIFILSSSFSFGGGGVDVGNGTSRSVLVHTAHTYSESELEKVLSERIRKLNKSSDSLFNTATVKANCSKAIQIKGIDQDSGFKIVNSKVSFKRQYKGIIKVQLEKCEKPHLLPQDIISKNEF